MSRAFLILAMALPIAACDGAGADQLPSLDKDPPVPEVAPEPKKKPSWISRILSPGDTVKVSKTNRTNPWRYIVRRSDVYKATILAVHRDTIVVDSGNYTTTIPVRLIEKVTVHDAQLPADLSCRVSPQHRFSALRKNTRVHIVVMLNVPGAPTNGGDARVLLVPPYELRTHFSGDRQDSILHIDDDFLITKRSGTVTVWPARSIGALVLSK
ncbi:MAG: hypothetical protein IID44_31930 [Planctomycetes bacterium]|nr:hypothetical protein [Planctomycetota bacterium]